MGRTDRFRSKPSATTNKQSKGPFNRSRHHFIDRHFVPSVGGEFVDLQLDEFGRKQIKHHLTHWERNAHDTARWTEGKGLTTIDRLIRHAAPGIIARANAGQITDDDFALVWCAVHDKLRQLELVVQSVALSTIETPIPDPPSLSSRFIRRPRLEPVPHLKTDVQAVTFTSPPDRKHLAKNWYADFNRSSLILRAWIDEFNRFRLLLEQALYEDGFRDRRFGDYSLSTHPESFYSYSGNALRDEVMRYYQVIHDVHHSLLRHHLPELWRVNPAEALWSLRRATDLAAPSLAWETAWSMLASSSPVGKWRLELLESRITQLEREVAHTGSERSPAEAPDKERHRNGAEIECEAERVVKLGRLKAIRQWLRSGENYAALMGLMSDRQVMDVFHPEYLGSTGLGENDELVGARAIRRMVFTAVDHGVHFDSDLARQSLILAQQSLPDHAIAHAITVYFDLDTTRLATADGTPLAALLAEVSQGNEGRPLDVGQALLELTLPRLRKATRFQIGDLARFIIQAGITQACDGDPYLSRVTEPVY